MSQTFPLIILLWWALLDGTTKPFAVADLTPPRGPRDDARTKSVAASDTSVPLSCLQRH